MLITQMSFGDRKVLEPILGVGFPDLRFPFCTMGLGVPPPHTAEPGTPPSMAAIGGPMVGCPLECRGPEPQEKGGLAAPPSPPDPVPSSNQAQCWVLTLRRAWACVGYILSPNSFIWKIRGRGGWL